MLLLLYALGFLWGDGSFRNNNIAVEIIKKDLDEILPILNSLINWKYSTRIRPGRQPQATIRVSNKKLAKYLQNYGYISHRLSSPDNIINLFPLELQKFWYLGFLDADGNWYYNHKLSMSQLTFSGNIGQNWNFIEIFLKQFNINYKIGKIILEKQSSSFIRVVNREDIKKIGIFLYEGHALGLNRKRQKFELINNHYKSPKCGEKLYNAKLTDKQVIEIKQSNASNRQLAKKFQVSTRLIWRIKKGETWKHITINQ